MDARKETDGVVQSSRMIVEQHGGNEGLARKLKTDLEVSDHRQHFSLSRGPYAVFLMHIFLRDLLHYESLS